MDIEFSNDVFARIGEDCTKVVNRIAGLEKRGFKVTLKEKTKPKDIERN